MSLGPLVRQMNDAISRFHDSDLGMRFTRKGNGFMVNTPWYARRRWQFAEDWLEKLRPAPGHAIMRLERWLFSDVKKFCLRSEKTGRWVGSGKRGTRAPDYNLAYGG